MDVELLKKTRVGRIFRLRAPSGEYKIEYNGYGFGYESVLVNGETVARKKSLVRMIPQFEFPIGPHTGIISIETKLWRDLFCLLIGRLESFILEVDNEVVYEDGKLKPVNYYSKTMKGINR